MAVTDEDPVLFNPLAPGYEADPYTQLARLRAEDPVHLSPLGPWMLFRYADVFALLRDASTSVSDDSVVDDDNYRAQLREAVRAEEGAVIDNRDFSILNMDPPDHTRMRKLMSQAFTPRMIERLRPRIQVLVDEALDRAADETVWDLVDGMAFPLPFQVISEMLGLPESDRGQIRDWSHTLTRTLDPIISDEEMRAAVRASMAMNEHLAEVIEWKRSNRADDVLTALLEAEDDGDRLSAEELRSNLVLLFIAGHETTVNLIGNGMLALLHNRDELRRWQDDPSLDGGAPDELLRYDPPVQMSRRIPMTQVEIGGKTIEPGAFVMVSLASANRDPAHWGPTADQLDLGREGTRQHLAFGSGAHHCLGASLARLEAEVALSTLIRRFPEVEQAGDEVRNGRINLRGLDALPLALA